MSTYVEGISDDLSAPDAGAGPGRKVYAYSREAQEKFLVEYARTGTLKSAALACDISERTAASWLARPGAVDVLHSIRERILRTEGASVGLRILLEIAQDERAPQHVRRAAAKDLLGYGGHSEASAVLAAAAGQGRKGLEDMSAEELERVAVAATATLGQLRKQTATVDVAPDPPAITPDASDGASLL